MRIVIGVLSAAALTVAAVGSAVAADAQIAVTTLDTVLAGKPLADGANKVMDVFTANKSQLQVLTISRIKLHHHEQEDHVVYVARGSGKGRIETAPGRIEVREVRAGDFYVLPKNLRHAFEKSGGDDLVLLVVATAGWKPLEDTKFHE